MLPALSPTLLRPPTHPFCAAPTHHPPPPSPTIPPFQGLETTGEESVEVHRYPFAGGANARVTLWALRFDDVSLEQRWVAATAAAEKGEGGSGSPPLLLLPRCVP